MHGTGVRIDLHLHPRAVRDPRPSRFKVPNVSVALVPGLRKGSMSNCFPTGFHSLNSKSMKPQIV